jgi:hypothetical protein
MTRPAQQLPPLGLSIAEQRAHLAKLRKHGDALAKGIESFYRQVNTVQAIKRYDAGDVIEQRNREDAESAMR